jgi:hypothetical protein
MPMMKSPAGDMEITIRGVSVDGDNLVAKGQFGTWDATIVLTPQEVKELIPMVLKGGVVGYALTLPFKKKKD